MFLYHINRESPNITIFKPKIPSMSITESEPKIKRICVSTDIEGCFSAVYFGCNELKYSMYANYDSDISSTSEYTRFKLYVFDSEEIKSENLINHLELNEKKLVFDSLITKEYWIINQSIAPIEILEIEVHSFLLDKLPYTNHNGATNYISNISNLQGKIISSFVRVSDDDSYEQKLNNHPIGLISFNNYFDLLYKLSCIL